jgi:hypothetical protein
MPLTWTIDHDARSSASRCSRLGRVAQGGAVDGSSVPGFAGFSAVQHLGVTRGARSLDHLEDALGHAAFTDLVVGAHQLQRLALDQRILLLLERPKPLRPRPDIGRPESALDGISSKKYDTGTPQHLGKLVEPARTDAVGAAFILLDLLEGEAAGIADFSLAHAQQGATLPYPRPNMGRQTS